MSEQVFHREGMTATNYTGPARSDGGSRERVQLYNHHGGDNRLIDLSAEQWSALGDWFEECRKPTPRGQRTATGT